MRNRQRSCRRGYTLIEMLTTVAVLVIVLGLMVSLARYVRYRSKSDLTREVLGRLDQFMDQYHGRYGALPAVTPLIPPAEQAAADEHTLLSRAEENNRQFVLTLRRMGTPAGYLRGLPGSMYDEVMLRDPWDHPIVFMATQHPDIGIQNRFFFFSPGPDGRYLSRDDNVYSYDVGERR